VAVAEAQQQVEASDFLVALERVHRELSCVVGTGEDGTDEAGFVVLRTQGLDTANLNPPKLEQLLRLLTTTFPHSAKSTTGAWLRGGARGWLTEWSDVAVLTRAVSFYPSTQFRHNSKPEGEAAAAEGEGLGGGVRGHHGRGRGPKQRAGGAWLRLRLGEGREGAREAEDDEVERNEGV
jgi:hypothetical protein